MNYHYSGMSTPEAIQDFESHVMSKLPRLLRFLVKRGILKPTWVICCDGCGRKELISGKAELLPTSRSSVKQWQGSQWTHQNRLDFCEVCSINGTADRAVKDGLKPLGSYTFG